MKKLTLTLLLLCISILGYCGDFYTITDLYDYSAYLKHNFQYKSEKIDYQQTVTETLELKTFDCDDVAYLNKYWLLKNGYSAQMYFIVVPQGGHMVTLLKKEGQYWMFDNQEICPSMNTSPVATILEYYPKCKLIALQFKVLFGRLTKKDYVTTRKTIWKRSWFYI